jgi:dihydrofolate reductase
MRTLYAGLFVSLDGVAEAPNRFVSPFFDEAVGAEVGAGMARTDTVLLGRKLYDEWAAYWPGKTAADDPYADFINAIRKVVFSTTLARADWQNTTLVGEHVFEAIAALKEEDGGDIAINGSITLAQFALATGLLDELRLLVFPVLVGSGRRLLDGLENIPLRLIEAKPLPTGVLSLTYGRPTPVA